MGQHSDDALNYFTQKKFGMKVVGDESRKKSKRGKKRDTDSANVGSAEVSFSR